MKTEAKKEKGNYYFASVSTIRPFKGNMKIAINLQEGFENDEVIIFVNQNKLFQAENVRTRTQIGLAKVIEFEVSEKEANIKVIIQSRGINENKEIDLVENPYIGISITNENKLDWQLSSAPFMYM